MDIASIFKELSQGKIISSASKDYKEHVYFLLDEDCFNETSKVLDAIGYTLIGENGYFYMSKKGSMSVDEIDLFISKHKDSIIAISLLRQLFPRLDRGSTISFMSVASEYEAYKKNDSTIKDKMESLSWSKNKDDEKAMLEQVFKYLEKNYIIEKIEQNNENDFKVLDAIDYYINIVELAESKGE